MIIPNFEGDLPARMEKLGQILKGKSDIILVGSSFGGLMASIFCMEEETRVKKMVLLAPAINHLHAAVMERKTISAPVTIYHGRNDEVIPLNDMTAVAKETFEHLALKVVDDDHFLHKTFRAIDWESALS
jgi:predicted esterase